MHGVKLKALKQHLCGLQVFACTVGQKPSKAPYYVNDTEDVLYTLQRLTESSIAGGQARPARRGPTSALPPRAA